MVWKKWHLELVRHKAVQKVEAFERKQKLTMVSLRFRFYAVGLTLVIKFHIIIIVNQIWLYQISQSFSNSLCVNGPRSEQCYFLAGVCIMEELMSKEKQESVYDTPTCLPGLHYAISELKFYPQPLGRPRIPCIFCPPHTNTGSQQPNGSSVYGAENQK